MKRSKQKVGNFPKKQPAKKLKKVECIVSKGDKEPRLSSSNNESHKFVDEEDDFAETGT